MNSRIVQPAASFQPPETCTEHEECQAAQASHSELCDKALAHYEEVSAAAHHWNSLVPRAIEFYKLHGDRASVAAVADGGSMSPGQLERATLIAESRGIDLETAQELVYLRDRASAVERDALFVAYNQAIEDAKAAIRGEKVDDPYAAPIFINAIARKCSPHVYVARLTGSPPSITPSATERDLAYADGYNDGFRQGKQARAAAKETCPRCAGSGFETDSVTPCEFCGGDGWVFRRDAESSAAASSPAPAEVPLCGPARPDDGSECLYGACPRPRDGCSEYCWQHHKTQCAPNIESEEQENA